MAQSPLKTIAQVIGLQAALDARVRAHVGPTPPANPQTGDLWFQTPDITPPTIGVLSASGGAGSLSLSWTAATDDVGVTLYEYTYGTAADYVGATVATTATLSASLSVASGTYYCRLRARDAANNWSSYSTASAVATAAQYTAPVIAGALTATPGASSSVLTGPTATGTITKWQYTKDGGANWVDVASTSAAFPSTTVSSLTPLTSITFGVRAVNVTAASSTLNGTCTPFWMNDFEAGQALDTARLNTAAAGTGAVTVALNKATVNSPGDTDGALLRHISALDKTKSWPYEHKTSVITLPNGSWTGLLCLRNAATQPGIIASANEDVRAYFTVNCNTPNYIVQMAYKDGASTWMHYWYAGVNAGTWNNTSPAGSDCYFSSSLLGTILYSIMETDYNSGTPRFRFILKNASATVITTTPWVNFSSIYGDATNTYWIDLGDRFNDIWSGKQEVAHIKVG